MKLHKFIARLALLPFLISGGANADQITVSPGLLPNANGQIPSMSAGVAPSTIWSSTAAQSISTTTETSLFSSTGAGAPNGLTVAGGVQYVGNRFWLHAAGVVTTPVTGGSITLKVKYGSTAVATISGLALLISLTNAPWVFDAYCTIRSVSATPSLSTMVCSGSLIGATSSPTTFATSSAVSIDTTTNAKIDATWTWGSVAGSQALSVTDAHADILF